MGTVIKIGRHATSGCGGQPRRGIALHPLRLDRGNMRSHCVPMYGAHGEAQSRLMLRFLGNLEQWAWMQAGDPMVWCPSMHMCWDTYVPHLNLSQRKLPSSAHKENHIFMMTVYTVCVHVLGCRCLWEGHLLAVDVAMYAQRWCRWNQC